MAEHVLPFIPDQALRAPLQSGHPVRAVATILLCDNALLRIGLQDLLRGTPFAPAVTASTANATRVQDVVSESVLVLIEASRSIGHLLEVVRRVRAQSPNARIVALADQFELDFVRVGYQAGVDGFCSSASIPEVLIKSLELVMLGESVLPFEVLRSMSEEPLASQGLPRQGNTAEPSLPDLMMHRLSAREAQILSCLREGAPNKLIARKLEITEATIKVHVKAILRKIGATNRTQAAMWATKHLPPRGEAVQHL